MFADQYIFSLNGKTTVNGSICIDETPLIGEYTRKLGFQTNDLCRSCGKVGDIDSLHCAYPAVSQI